MPVVPDGVLEAVAHRFALLGDPTRLRIVSVLHDLGDSSVGEIAAAAGTSVANASQHLRRLALGGVVGRRRDGQAVRYRITDGTIAGICAIVCAGLEQHPAAPGPAAPGGARRGAAERGAGAGGQQE